MVHHSDVSLYLVKEDIFTLTSSLRNGALSSNSAILSWTDFTKET